MVDHTTRSALSVSFGFAVSPEKGNCANFAKYIIKLTQRLEAEREKTDISAAGSLDS